MLLWMLLLLSAKKVRLDLTELRNSEGALLSLLPRRLAYVFRFQLQYIDICAPPNMHSPTAGCSPAQPQGC